MRVLVWLATSGTASRFLAPTLCLRQCVCVGLFRLLPPELFSELTRNVAIGVGTDRLVRGGFLLRRKLPVCQLGAVTSTAAAFDDAGAALCGAIRRTEISNQDGRQGGIVSLCGRLLCSMSLSVGVNASSRANLTLVATGCPPGNSPIERLGRCPKMKMVGGFVSLCESIKGKRSGLKFGHFCRRSDERETWFACIKEDEGVRRVGGVDGGWRSSILHCNRSDSDTSSSSH
jgi:hypothetical protein